MPADPHLIGNAMVMRPMERHARVLSPVKRVEANPVVAPANDRAQPHAEYVMRSSVA